MTQTNPVAPPPAKPEPSWSDILAYPLACIGAMLGAAAGAFASWLAARSGLYALIVVGICAGFGVVLLVRRSNMVIALIAGVIALTASLLTEWWLYPWIIDDSLTYFLQHVGDLPGFHLLIHAVGAACAGYIAWRK